MHQYKAARSLTCNGSKVAKGGKIELSDEDAAILVERGLVTPASKSAKAAVEGEAAGE